MKLSQVGRFEIRGLLGRGAMADVHLAYDPELNREVALKIISTLASDDEMWLQRFRREVQVAGQLNHPHIVTIYDVDLNSKSPYIVMELLTGGTLKEKLAQKTMGWQEALTLHQPLARALAYAHRAGVIHRDVKPANVMFTGDGILKLVDFGLARWQGGEKLTQTGALVGTPAYMSPEQAGGELVDIRADIFAVGVILLEAITGHNPLTKGTLTATIAALTSKHEIDISALDNSSIPATVKTLIKRTVAKERDRRYPTCGALLADIDRCLDGQISRSMTLLPPLRPTSRGPSIHPAPKIRLTAQIEAILQAMFSDFGWVEVQAEFGDGFSGCRVFRVHPVEAGGRVRLPAVVKIGPTRLILHEWQAYQTWVKDTLPEIAQLKGKPICPIDSDWAGLSYSLVGSGTFSVQSLREYIQQATIGDLTWVFNNRLFKIMGDHWWRFNQAVRLQLRTEYDPILPVNLLITPLDTPSDDASMLIEPGNIPVSLESGQYVHLRGFIITGIDQNQRQLILNLPSTNLDEPAVSYRICLVNVPDIERYTVEQVVDLVYGKIEKNRRDLLVEQATLALGAAVDLLSAHVLTLPDGLNIPMASEETPGNNTLPNPLFAYADILNSFLTVHTSTIHGDLNLDNILVDPETRHLTVIDFAAARRGHVLRDLLRLEATIVTKVIAPALARAGLAPETIVTLYWQLHHAVIHPEHTIAGQSLHVSLDKSWVMLIEIRHMAREFLFKATDWKEYYYGLSLYLLGTLKFKDLDNPPHAPWPKQTAFWGAATSIHLSNLPVNLPPPRWGQAPDVTIFDKPQEELATPESITAVSGDRAVAVGDESRENVIVTGNNVKISQGTQANKFEQPVHQPQRPAWILWLVAGIFVVGLMAVGAILVAIFVFT